MRTRRALLILITALLLALLFIGGPARATYGTYDDLLISTFGSKIIALWPLNETSGTTAYDISGHGYNGTIHGVTLDSVDGAGASFGRAGLWDAINDYVDIYSAGYSAAFTSNKGAMSIWFKVFSSAVWTDGAYRNIVRIRTAGGGELALTRGATNNQLYVWITGSGGQKTINYIGTWTTNWYNLLATWDTDEKLHAYINGAEIGTPQSGLTTWSNPPASNKTNIGAKETSELWSGYLQHVLSLNAVPTAGEIAIIANASPPEPTPTNTVTPTSTTTATQTPRPPELVLTLTNGNQYEIDYRITAGDIAQFIPALMLIAFLIFLIILRLVRR
jgi:hypothetical protein